MSSEAIAIPVVIVVVAVALRALYISVNVVREKEVMIIERLGVYKDTLTAGVHCIIPFVDQPKRYSQRYYLASPDGGPQQLVSKSGQTKVLTQNEVLDFPEQTVITRDNATIKLDAVLNYRVAHPKTMIYNTQNLPNMLSKILQAQIRNVAGSLDVDQIIEDTAAMDRVSGEIDHQAQRWGVKVDFVKIQKVHAGVLTSVLAKKKNADLKNQEVIINAKASKQTRVIESEGHRDRMIREAEGEAQQILSQARGHAQAIINAAVAEARSVKEVARAISQSGENPTKYLLALKYVDALKAIMQRPNTEVRFMPHETSFLQTVQGFGLNTIATK